MLLEQKREALLNSNKTRSLSISTIRNDNENQNTLTFVFVSNDNAGVRYDWGSGEYYNETLDVTGAKVERLNTFFKNHARDVDSAIGKISNVRVDNGQLLGDVTFGTDEDSQKILRKYEEGILTDVSVGYTINGYTVEQGATNERDNVTVTDFDIFEVSAVGIGFDSGAKKRSEDEEQTRSLVMDKELMARLASLEAIVNRSVAENEELVALQRARDEEFDKLKKENLELKRVSEIDGVASKYNVSTEIRNKFVEDKSKSVADFQLAILEERAMETKQQNLGTSDKGGDTFRMLSDALALRLGMKSDNVHADAHKYRSAPLSAIANLMLPEKERSFNPLEIAERSLVTGDFPLLLLSAGNRVLESEYDSQVGTYDQFVKQVDVSDFRLNSDLTVGQGGRLDKVLENGDLRELTRSEHAESWKLESFGNKFVLTREMIINDDLGAFTNMLAIFAQMAATTANGLAYDILRASGNFAGYKMSDGTDVFSVAHGNKASDALSSAAISTGRTAMRNQKGIDGVTPLNIVPKYLVVAPALEETAKLIISSTAKLDATNSGVINVHQNSMQIIVDAELTSATEWYMLAERRTIKMGFLSGTNRKPTLKMNDSSVSRKVFEGVFDIGLVVEDYRGMYQGNQ